MSASGRNTPTAGSAGGATGALIVGIAGGIVPSDGNNNANFTGPVGTGGQFSGLGAAASVFNGATWDRQRTPAVFKQAAITAVGPTTVWTPTAGKKFRLMKLLIGLDANAAQAVAGAITVQLVDGGLGFWTPVEFFVPGASAAGAGANFAPAIDMGNGYLSTAANNALGVTLTTAITTGRALVAVMGTEE